MDPNLSASHSVLEALLQAARTMSSSRTLSVKQEFFANAPGVLFQGLSFADDMEKAWGCFRHLRTVFQELEECRAFELLKVRELDIRTELPSTNGLRLNPDLCQVPMLMRCSMRRARRCPRSGVKCCCR